MDINVRGDRLVNEGAETEPEVRGVLGHAKSQSNADCLQLTVEGEENDTRQARKPAPCLPFKVR